MYLYYYLLYLFKPTESLRIIKTNIIICATPKHQLSRKNQQGSMTFHSLRQPAAQKKINLYHHGFFLCPTLTEVGTNVYSPPIKNDFPFEASPPPEMHQTRWRFRLTDARAMKDFQKTTSPLRTAARPVVYTIQRVHKGKTRCTVAAKLIRTIHSSPCTLCTRYGGSDSLKQIMP